MPPFVGIITYLQHLLVSIGNNLIYSKPLFSISDPHYSASSKICLLIISLLCHFPCCLLYRSLYVAFCILRTDLLLSNKLVLSCLLHILSISILRGTKLIFIAPFLILLIPRKHFISR